MHFPRMDVPVMANLAIVLYVALGARFFTFSVSHFYVTRQEIRRVRHIQFMAILAKSLFVAARAISFAEGFLGVLEAEPRTVRQFDLMAFGAKFIFVAPLAHLLVGYGVVFVERELL